MPSDLPGYTPPTTFRELIDLFPSRRAFGRKIRTIRQENLAQIWWEKDDIPAKHWDEVVRVCRAAGFPGITYALLTTLARAKRLARQEPI